MPSDVALRDLRAADVDAVLAKAVGDPVVTRWYRGGAWKAVLTQLDGLRAQAAEAGAAVVTSGDEVRAAEGLVVLLGLEGADAIGDDLDRVDRLHELGVRVVGPIHLGDNQFGTTSLPWQRYVGPLPVRRRHQPGLSPLGGALVDRLQKRGLLVDLAHADAETLFAVVDRATRPVVSTHTGARALQDFPRYLSDDEARAIAGTGGVIGLWPYRHRGKGLRDVDDFVAHARHLAEVIGIEHLCIGTDMNGVPGLMDGYRGERDLPRLADALSHAGFTDPEVAGIMGANFLRALDAAC